jgi:molybdopterin converting factor small subunit
MIVTARLFAGLRRFQPKGSEGAIPVNLADGADVRALLAALGIPEESAGIVVVNDRHAELTTALADGLEVNLFPPLAGGIAP